MAVPRIHDLPRRRVGSGEGGVVGLELEDEAVEHVLEVGQGAVDFRGDGGGDGDAAGNGGARGAEGGAVGGDGALEIGENGGREVVFGGFHGICSDEGGGLVVHALGGFIEQAIAEVLEHAYFQLELGGGGVVFRFKGVGPGGSGDDD